MKKSITLWFDEQTMERLKHVAAVQRTSMTTWVAQLIQSTLSELESFELARTNALRSLERPAPVESGPLVRDQIYESDRPL